MDRAWRHNDQLGVNKIGKNIKKSPLHQSNFSNGFDIASARLQPQPQVSNIGKSGFRSMVQQLKSSPSRESLLQNPLEPQRNTRLQKIRAAAQIQRNRLHVPPPVMAQPTHELVSRPPMQPYMHQGSQPLTGHGDHFLSNTGEPPVSKYMRYLQSSLGDSGPNGNQMQSSHEYQPQPQVQGQAHPPRPQWHNHHLPQFNGSARDKPILPTPRFNVPPQQMYDNSIPSPRFNGRGILPSPTSQYLLQSPSNNLLTPRLPYPLLSPPLTPRGSTLSPMGQPGILGPGTIPQPPVSPSSLYGVFPISSPRWRGY